MSMRSLIKSLLLSVVILLGCCLTQAQTYNYTASSTMGLFSTLPSCSSTVNCYLVTAQKSGGTNVNLTQVDSGYDGYTIGLDSAGAVWTLPVGDGVTKPVWSQLTAMGSGIKYLAVHDQNEIYGLFTDSSCGANSGNFLPEVWNGTSWTKLLGKCFVEISITADDMLIGVGHGTLITYTTNPAVSSPTWIAAANNSSGWSHVVGYVSGGIAYALKSTGVLYKLNLPNGTFTAMSGAPVASHLSITQDGYIFLVATAPGANGNTYYFNVETSTVWANLKGTMTTVEGSFLNGVFGLTGSLPYHFLATGLSLTNTVSGTSTCPPIQGCPFGSVHTATAHAYFTGQVGQTIQNSGAPTAQLNAVANDYSFGCDLLFGDPNSPSCTGQAPGDVQCNHMGNLYSGGGPIKDDWEFARTKVLYIGPTTGCHSGASGAEWCEYRVGNFCTAETTPPDLNLDLQNINDLYSTPPPNGWWVAGICYGTPGNWSCSYGASYRLFGPQSPAPCTKKL